MVETDAISFSWGKKKGRGGAKKEVQFYESFTYDDVEYFLYDSVYLYKENEQEPYIGKLIKIWEPPNKVRKVKVLWFFHPSEISNYLGHEKVLENEVFLATGEGLGLANINPLEAIAGKCNVLCISKDERNQQPSVKELEMADHVFYRTFDIGSLTVSDKLDEKIASIEVGFLLNKTSVQLPIQSQDIKVDCRDVAEVFEKPCISNKDISGEGNAIEPDANIGSLSVIGGEGMNNIMDKLKGSPGTHDVTEPDDRGPMTIPAAALSSVSGQKTELKSSDSKQSDFNEVVKSAPNVRLSAVRAGHKSELRGAVSLCHEKITNCVGLTVDSGGNIKNPVSSSVPSVKRKSEEKEFDGTSVSVKKLKSVNCHVALEESLSKKHELDGTPKRQSDNGKKLKLDGTATPATDDARNGAFQSAAVSLDRNKDSIPAATVSGKGKLTKEFDGLNNGHSEPLKSNSEEDNKSNDKLCKPFHKPAKGLEVKELVGTSNSLLKRLKSNDKIEVQSGSELSNGLSRKLKSDGMIKEKSNAKLHKASIKQSKNVEIEVYGCVKEVTRRPLTDKEKYYTSIESRIKIAQEQGTLVLLQNLDTAYTSSEVEDIVWCAFGEICSAKMVQSKATSSPNSGQAFVIFKTREAANMVVRMLEQECLMLPNLRPLIGIPGALSSPEKHSPFPGHLVVDKLKHQMQRESREAVSTSHSSQGNTLEYEMALEWCLLQDRSNLSWRKLCKQQAEELRKLKKSFQPKK